MKSLNSLFGVFSLLGEYLFTVWYNFFFSLLSWAPEWGKWVSSLLVGGEGGLLIGGESEKKVLPPLRVLVSVVDICNSWSIVVSTWPLFVLSTYSITCLLNIGVLSIACFICKYFVQMLKESYD